MHSEPKTYEYKELAYQGKTIFGKIVMGDFTRIEKYFREDEACFMFVENGDFIIRTPDKTLQINSEEGLLAKCGNYFFERDSKSLNPEYKMTLIAAYFYPEIVKNIFQHETLPSQNNLPDYDANKVAIDKLLSSFKENISFLLDNPDLVDEALILTKLKEFIILLSKSSKASSVIEFISALFRPYEYDFKSIIEKNCLSNLSISEIAMLSGMSLASFKRKFKEYYTTTPKVYIQKKKMLHAKQLLLNKEYRINDVAYDCGFDLVTTFNRNFKSFFGESPSSFRKKNI